MEKILVEKRIVEFSPRACGRGREINIHNCPNVCMHNLPYLHKQVKILLFLY